ncbi:MAG: pyruvate, water dikinase [Desulfofustis sp.]|nr:pyruvate, water dikinase [Desulfofustis sp.]
MRRIVSFLKSKLVRAPTPMPAVSPVELRAAFRKRYAHFRSLLTANNNALQAMADLEQIFYGGESYRMAVIRSKITTILVNVYKMVHDLIAMGDGKYQELIPVFERISDALEVIVQHKPEHQPGPMIISLAECGQEQRALVGDKMAHLGIMSRLDGFSVPRGFVVTAAATRYFLADLLDEINRRLQVLESDDLDGLYRTCAALREMIMAAPLPGDLQELLQVHYFRLEKITHPGCRVALRSSALGEDSRGISFAGLYNTMLGADRSNLVSGYKEVIAGKYGARAIAYRRRRGYRHEDIEMCVGCMEMIDARFGGVIYTRDPTNRDLDVLHVIVTSGLGKGVVDGTGDTELIRVQRRPPHATVDGGAPALSRSSAEEAAPLLTDAVLQHLASAALKIEAAFGEPQDIEWAIDHHDRLVILQSRPVQIDEEQIESLTVEPLSELENEEPPLLHGGVCASRGSCCGEVCRIDSEDAIGSFRKGAILVVAHPLPEWAPLLNQASGIIAETGSEAGHLATVSREFGIPALFGVTGAMTHLEDGLVVTLQADSRAVYRGRRDDLLRKTPAAKDPMAGSPVQRLLAEAMQLITPLNLTDPDAAQFKPSWCETLHDITRFCHEKSVTAMFSFGRTHHFDEGRAKRLVGEVPLEWWVVDLADGVRPGLDDDAKTIRVDDIVSIPMLAIWRGLSAFPWQGPPPVSARGFGSIIFQSTMRPELDPSVASQLTVKNYFLISKNFCHLSVRLGYHYALIEAYLSDLLTESYVTFRFKGGAADMGRKTLRVQLLAETLEHYGFRIELHADALLARLKKRPADYLEQRLQILGYLILHSRQLDMIMDQVGSFERYRGKFYSEIDSLFIEAPLHVTEEH